MKHIIEKLLPTIIAANFVVRDSWPSLLLALSIVGLYAFLKYREQPDISGNLEKKLTEFETRLGDMSLRVIGRK